MRGRREREAAAQTEAGARTPVIKASAFSDMACHCARGGRARAVGRRLRSAELLRRTRGARARTTETAWLCVRFHARLIARAVCSIDSGLRAYTIFSAPHSYL